MDTQHCFMITSLFNLTLIQRDDGKTTNEALAQSTTGACL